MCNCNNKCLACHCNSETTNVVRPENHEAKIVGEIPMEEIRFSFGRNSMLIGHTSKGKVAFIAKEIRHRVRPHQFWMCYIQRDLGNKLIVRPIRKMTPEAADKFEVKLLKEKFNSK